MLNFFKPKTPKSSGPGASTSTKATADTPSPSGSGALSPSGSGAPSPTWSQKLKSGLHSSSSKLTTGLAAIFTEKKLDAATLESLEELLIMSDMGTTVASSITTAIAKEKFDKTISIEEIKTILASKITDILQPVARPLTINPENRPHVILICGVNGSGKTTTIGKLAKTWQDEGKKIMLAACDTFRAAAVEQLEVWATRANCPIITGPLHSDPASVAHNAIEQAIAQNIDILIIDTAGRLQNKKNLMEQLSKIIRVINKQLPQAPHDTIIVLDATTGQNATSQVKTFKEITNITGIILTKLDGTAKGGILVSLAQQFTLPVHAIGIGEAITDLRPFAAEEFANNLVGVG